MSVTLPQDQRDDVTMQDIADSLDLSVATVSRALRRVPGINAKTRARVLEAATQLGYCPQHAYRNTPVNSKSLHHVGILVETDLLNCPPPYLPGMSDAAISLNVSLTIHYVKRDDCFKLLDPSNQPSAMRAGLLSGAIMVFQWPVEVVHELSKKLAVVSIMHKYPGLSVDMVGLDSMEGVNHIIGHLRKQGYQRIGFFGHSAKIHWANERYGAFASALAAHQITFHPDWVIEAPYEDLSSINFRGHDAIRKAIQLTREQNIDAWVCSCEPAGQELYTEMTKAGIRVPEEVGVTGFHRLSQSTPTLPDLTSISTSYESIGATALRRLIYRIQNPLETHRTILLPCNLYLGKSAVRKAAF